MDAVSEATIAKNKILVLGRAELDKTNFVNTIVTGTPQSNTSTETNSAQIKWLIDTRYFQANVEFWIDSTEQLPETHQQYMKQWLETPTKIETEQNIPMDSAMEELQQHLSTVVDAIIFVFDPQKPDTFLDILPWAHMAREYQPEVLLCTALPTKYTGQITSGSFVDDDGLKEQLFEWCVENGWEWVDLTDTDPDTEYTIQRIQEALTSNQWDTMKLKSTTKQDSKQPEKDTSETIEIGRPSEENEQKEWDGFDDVARKLDNTRIEALEKTLLSLSESKQGVNIMGVEPEDADDGDETAALVEKIRLLRSEISSMSDQEQARARAAEIAIALAKRF